MRKLRKVLIIFLLFFIYSYIANISQLNNKIVVIEGEKIQFNLCPFIKKRDIAFTSSDNESNYKIELNLFGKINLKTIEVTQLNELEVIPSGELIGLKLYTNGVLIVGMSDIEDFNHNKIKPYEDSDLKEGDMIIQIDDKEIDSVKTLKEVVNQSFGKKLYLTIVRDGEVFNTYIHPVKVNLSEYKIGLWVRDAATGVGTLTYYNPQNNEFGALGHGISDADTGDLVNIESGDLVSSKVISIKKGISGVAGEIRGSILNQTNIGFVKKNTNYGIFGYLNNTNNLNIDYSKKMKVALRNEIEEGSAQMLCNIDGFGVKEYNIEIVKLYLNNDYDNKSFMIKVVDEKLLKKTGGIIRGLSGAPIIQNGKLVGAVTNVLVANPEIGYGVFADLMIKNGK